MKVKSCEHVHITHLSLAMACNNVVFLTINVEKIGILILKYRIKQPH